MIDLFRKLLFMAIKMLLTLPGKDALSETNKDNFIFHSDYNTFKIVKTGTLSMTVNDNATNTAQAAHGLSYSPGFSGYLKAAGIDVVLGVGSRYYTSATANFTFLKMYTDATNVYATAENKTGGAITITVRYYLFEVPL